MRRLTTGLSVPLIAGALLLVGVAAAQPAPDREITATSMGPATLGNTETGLAVELGSSYTLTPGVTPFVDLEGVEVSQGGVTQFYALRSSGEGPELTVFITDNSEYQLASGIGPGATVDDAVAAYGAATVSFNTDNESREFAVFDRGPAGRVQFQVEGPTAGETAGNYDPVADGFNETTDIRPGSVVTRVWINCVSGQCPASQLADTGVGDLTKVLAVIGTTLVISGVLLTWRPGLSR